MKHRFLHILFAFIGWSMALGQQHATLTQYMFNGLAINPAYAGSQEALTINVLSRFQNVGLPGAPNTQSLAAHTPLKDSKIAVGLLVVNDKLSVIRQTGVNGIYAYRLPLNNKATLSMGLQMGFSSYRADYTELDIYQSDPLFAENVRQTRPNFGAGVFYSTDLFYAGLSMPHMMNNIFQRSDNIRTVYQNIPIMVNGGYVFTLSRMLKLKPNFLFKWVDKRAVELDINANFLFDEVLWLGFSYKFNNAANVILEVQATDQLRFGYSYSITTGPIRQAELGSHEVLLSYRFKYFSKGIVTPRYF